MVYTVQIKPSGYLLLVADGETVLQAAMRQGYEFPYSCGSGTCGTCMGRVISGTYTYGEIEPYALDDVADSENSALFCSLKPTSDMIIDVKEVYGPAFLPVRKAHYTVNKYHKLTEHVYQVLLTPKNKSIAYHAGQYIKITCNDGVSLPFSIANAPCADRHLELEIKTAAHNPYTCEIIEKIKNKSVLQLSGPYGNMIYRNTPDMPIIFLAGGTGIVPLHAIIEQALAENDRRQLHLYWGGKYAHTLYLREQMEVYTTLSENFSFTPVVNQTDAYWQGTAGVIHQVVEHHGDLSGYQVYASGKTALVYAAFNAFTAKGLKPQLLFSDTFTHVP